MKHGPQFLTLSDADCRAILDRNHVGRLAFLNKGHPEIEPLGYARKGDRLFMRSAYGTKIEALAHSPYAAFEVDEPDAPLDWRSVVVHGTVYMLPADGNAIELEQREQAVRALREVLPATFTRDDPTPERQLVYALYVDRMVGRMARTARAGDTRLRKRSRRSAR